MKSGIKFLQGTLGLCMWMTSALAIGQEVTGAGASFPAPLYAKWADSYNKATGAKINYQSVGSGAGIKQIKASTVDFGASDMPLKDQDLKDSGLIQFPTAIGGVVPVVNLKDIKPGTLKLTGQVLGDIFLGKITRWNDPALTELNPGLALPATNIQVVRRADGSGTSFIFTNYLSKVNAEWREKVGEGTAVNWPAGAGGKGNEGVAAFVSRLPNSIGYVEYAYVKNNGMNYAQIKNKDGVFVAPDDVSFQAAAANAQWDKSFNQVLTDQPGKASWPLTGATFVLLHAVQTQADKGKATLDFFQWTFQNGNAQATQLEYVPLPEPVKQLVRKEWGGVKNAAGKPVWTR